MYEPFYMILGDNKVLICAAFAAAGKLSTEYDKTGITDMTHIIEFLIVVESWMSS